MHINFEQYKRDQTCHRCWVCPECGWRYSRTVQFFQIYIHHIKQMHLSNCPWWHQAPSRSGWPKMTAVPTDGSICCNCPGKHVLQPFHGVSIPGQVTNQIRGHFWLESNTEHMASVGTFDYRHLRASAVTKLISGLTLAKKMQGLVSCILDLHKIIG